MATGPSLVESAKKTAAFKAVENHFSPTFTHVGIGSGSTVQYVVEAIAETIQKTPPKEQIVFVPTGSGSKKLCDNAGLTTITFDSLSQDQTLDVAFDGADEVDEELNLIKGGGACLFQEKIVAIKAKTFVVVADFRKDVHRLLTDWEYIPIEVAPIAVNTVLNGLRSLGSPNPELRVVTIDGKSAPVKTDQNFYLVKAPFPPLLTYRDPGAAPLMHGGAEGATKAGLRGRIWEAGQLSTAIKSIAGVLEVGLFTGVNGPEAQKMGGQGGQKPVAVYFGMEDGGVKIRRAVNTTASGLTAGHT